jgi:hypothetical protein
MSNPAPRNEYRRSPVQGARELAWSVIAVQSFDRRRDAIAWQSDQLRRLRAGEWTILGEVE